MTTSQLQVEVANDTWAPKHAQLRDIRRDAPCPGSAGSGWRAAACGEVSSAPVPCGFRESTETQRPAGFQGELRHVLNELTSRIPCNQQETSRCCTFQTLVRQQDPNSDGFFQV